MKNKKKGGGHTALTYRHVIDKGGATATQRDRDAQSIRVRPNHNSSSNPITLFGEHNSLFDNIRLIPQHNHERNTPWSRQQPPTRGAYRVKQVEPEKSKGQEHDTPTSPWVPQPRCQLPPRVTMQRDQPDHLSPRSSSGPTQSTRH